MSDEFELLAESRTDVGKGASRRLRRAGRLPAVVYGHHSEATPITLDANTIKHQLDNEAFYSHILTLKLNGKSERVVLKDLQSHPHKPLAMHLDLQRVSEDEALHMNIPLHYLHEEECKGVKQGGGILSRNYNDIEVLCLPRDLPEYFEVDVLELDIGDSIHMNEVQLPKGVELYAAHHGGDIEQPIVTVMPPVVEEEPEQTDEEDAEATAIGKAEDDEAKDDKQGADEDDN